MNDRIRHLLNQMNALEGEMRTAAHAQETKMFFEIKGKRIEFETTVRPLTGRSGSEMAEQRLHDPNPAFKRDSPKSGRAP